MIRYQRKCRTTASRCRASKTITGLELFLLPPNKLVTFCPLKEYKSISIELDNMHHKQVKSRMLARTLWRKRFARSSKCERERERKRENYVGIWKMGTWRQYQEEQQSSFYFILLLPLDVWLSPAIPISWPPCLLMNKLLLTSEL